MADGQFNLLEDMFKNFPVFTVILIMVFIYLLWYSTGGVERGEERRAAAETSLVPQFQMGTEEEMRAAEEE